MPTTLYAHLTWTTYRRKPLIDGGVARFLRKFLPATAKRCGADLLSVGIVNDHVHALLLLPSQIDVPKFSTGVERRECARCESGWHSDGREATVGEWLRPPVGFAAST